MLRIQELGGVRESCAEVLDIVFEVELERIHEAIAAAHAFCEEAERELRT